MCFRGIFRTHADAIRRRPLADYRAVLMGQLGCSNPEASHYIERAAMQIYASI